MEWAYVIRHGLHHTVIDASNDETVAFDIRDKKDALLIESAPRLYEALQRLVGVMDTITYARYGGGKEGMLGDACADAKCLLVKVDRDIH